MKSEKTVLLCGQLFAALDENVQENMAVIISGQRITQVLPMAQADHAGAEVIDLSDKFVMPGLIDGHVHVNFDGSSLLQYFTDMSIGDITIVSINHAQTDLLAGFTTLRDEGAFDFTDVAVKRAINGGKLTGPRIFVSGMPITATGGHADGHFNHLAKGAPKLGIVCNSEDAVREAVRFNLKYGADQIKLMATGGVMSFGDDPKYSELSFEEMKMAIDTAKSRGKITSAHAHGSDGIKIAVKAGITSIEHGMLIDDECIELMSRHDVYLIPTIIAAKLIAGGEKYNLPMWMVDKAKAVIENVYLNLEKCRKAGVRIGFGSDAGTRFNYHGKQTAEMEYMLDAGFSPAEILIAATRTNAALMGWEQDIGTLEAGRFADIVAFDRSPLTDMSTVHAVSFVMKDGAVVKKDGRSTVIVTE